MRTTSFLSLHQSSLCGIVVAQAGVPQSRAKESPGTLPSGFRRQAEILNLNHELRPPTPSSSAPTPALTHITVLTKSRITVADKSPCHWTCASSASTSSFSTNHVHLRRCQCTPATPFYRRDSIDMLATMHLSSRDGNRLLTAYPQVLRWSALGFGVFYGAYHQLSLSARDKANASKKEWEHKESLIRQAKAEWAKSHPEAAPKSSGGTSKQRSLQLSE
jgi:F-type H+-transporting ATP synthase subunit e